MQTALTNIHKNQLITTCQNKNFHWSHIWWAFRQNPCSMFDLSPCKDVLSCGGRYIWPHVFSDKYSPLLAILRSKGNSVKKFWLTDWEIVYDFCSKEKRQIDQILIANITAHTWPSWANSWVYIYCTSDLVYIIQ